MRILFICTENYAGLLPFGANIINAFDDQEVSCILVSSPKSDYRNNLDKSFQRDVHVIDEPEGSRAAIIFRLLPLQVIKKIGEFTAKKKFDIIHLLTEDTGLALYAGWLKKKGNLVYTVHDLVPHEAKHQSILHKLKRKLMVEYRFKLLLKSVPNLVTCNQLQYEALKESYPHKRVWFHSFPSLITPQIRNGNREVPELKGIRDYILFFGRVEKYKGVDVLYQAYINDPALQRYPLVIAGSGFLYFDRDRAKEGNVIFINRYIHEEEIPFLYRNCISTVYPYISATQSGVTSLSFYFNKPIVASDIPFFAAELRNRPHCYLFRSENTDSLRTVLTGSLHHSNEPPPQNTYKEPNLKQELLNIYNAIIQPNQKHEY
jgi:glycosyltransferase involved in cell wall biosynthesis